jgi:hypothetical protein
MFFVPMRPTDAASLVAIYADRMPAERTKPSAPATTSDVQVPAQRRAEGWRGHLPRFAGRH